MRFIPPPYYRDYLRYHYRKPEEWGADFWEELRAKMRKFRPDHPEVSIVVIVYNEEDYILGTLASLADLETEYATEILMVNNNSTDATEGFLKRSGVRYIQQPTPGIPEARQAGLNAARGHYILTGDADTIYRREWVDELVGPLKDGAVACSYSMYVFYAEDGRYSMGHVLYHWAKLLSMQMKNYRRAHLNAMGGGMSYRRDQALEVGGYSQKMRRGSDGHLAWKLSRKYGKVIFVNRSKADVYSNMRRAAKDGSLFQAFWKRAVKQLRYFSHYLKKQEQE